MNEAVEVILWGTRIGVVSTTGQGETPRFQYAPEFLDSHIEVAPLMMPLSRDIYSFPIHSRMDAFKGLPGLLADSLPDKFGNAVLSAWLEERGRSIESLTALERLSYAGSRGMGALEYRPALTADDRPEEAVKLDEIARLAEEVLTRRKDARAELKDGMTRYSSILKVGSSAGGARAKALIAWNEKTGEVRSGQVALTEDFGYWLMKFDGISANGDHDERDADGYGRIEYAYHLMACAAGIEMTECSLWDGRHFMTRRFDRLPGGRKLHAQTLGAIAHLDFNQPRIHSYEKAFDVTRRVVGDSRALEQLFRRMVFNALAWNCDDHVKNITYLMEHSGTWRLAPAYDMTYSHSLREDGWTSAHQMSINGKFIDAGYDDFMACSRAANLSPRKAKSIISEVRDAVSEWSRFALEAGVDAEKSEDIGQMISNMIYSGN